MDKFEAISTAQTNVIFYILPPEMLMKMKRQRAKFPTLRNTNRANELQK